jgi:carboxymethylenebutenolidase
MSGILSDVAVLRSASAPTVGADDVVDTSAHESPPREKVPLTAVEPDGPPRGGIVVLHEAREVPESLLDLLRALALEGWLAVAPNLFHRGHGDDKEVFGDDLFADFDATSDWLVQRGVYPDCVLKPRHHLVTGLRPSLATAR